MKEKKVKNEKKSEKSTPVDEKKKKKAKRKSIEKKKENLWDLYGNLGKELLRQNFENTVFCISDSKQEKTLFSPIFMYVFKTVG